MTQWKQPISILEQVEEEIPTWKGCHYIKSDVDNVEVKLKKKGDQMLSTAVTPMSQEYYPETDLYLNLINMEYICWCNTSSLDIYQV